MRTKRIKLYKFEELTSEAQQNAIEKLAHINLEFGIWWESVYDDAKYVGVKIKGFDIDRGSYCEIDLIWNHLEVANAIIKEHGDMCDTYKMSKDFIYSFENLQTSIDKLISTENEDLENEIESLDDDLLDLKESYIADLSECYLNLLREEYEYLSSEEAIKETIISNEYEFLKDGTQY